MYKRQDLKGGGNILDVTFVKDNPKQETVPSTQDKPSAGKQENQASQSGSENAASYNAANNAAGNNTVNSTANSQPAAPKTDSVPVVVLPQGDGNTAVTDQAAAVPPAASATPPAVSTAPPKTSASSVAGTTITGDIVADAAGTGNDTAEALIPDTNVELEHIVLSTGEDGMDLVVLPADAAASDKEQPGMLGILLKVLIGVVAVSMVAVAVVGFIQFRRDRYDSE